MNSEPPLFLPGVPEDLVRSAIGRAAGNEIASGKFASPQSSAALAANGFGWFIERPSDLPMFPPIADIAGPAVSVELEREVRFPWSGGRHPWLDAVVQTATHIIGVESKRHEPYRDHKTASLAEAYDRDVWGAEMGRWCAVRDLLRAEPRRYRYLDAAQLVKHAYGLASEQTRTGLVPVLLYLYAEPQDLQPSIEACLTHRREIEDFHARIAGDRVRFATCSWRGWLATFTGPAHEHARAIERVFRP